MAACTEDNAGDSSPYPRQDGRYGRDAQFQTGQLVKIGGGAAGFDFTPLDNGGNPIAIVNDLPASPPDCIRDNVTGLVWEVKTWDSELRDKDWAYTWYNPNARANGGDPGNPGSATCGGTLSGNQCNTSAYVNAVNTGGLCGIRDWRLPTSKELQGIVLADAHSPAIDTHYFPNTRSGAYWSATPDPFDASLASMAWSICFDRGLSMVNPKTDLNGIRLVHGAPSANTLAALVHSASSHDTFADNGDGTVTHTSTGLMWAQCSDGQSGPACANGTPTAMTWAKALSAAKDSRLAGHDDWRLPNKKELESLVDAGHRDPAIDVTVFPSTSGDGHWSSTTDASDPSLAWGVLFKDGGSNVAPKTGRHDVRLVRDGKSGDGRNLKSSLRDSPLPDLVVTRVTGPSSGTLGSSIAVSATVKNQGNARAATPAGNLFVDFLLFTSSDNYVTTFCNIGPLDAGATGSCNASLAIPSTLTAGTYHLGAVVDIDKWIAESNEDNNLAVASNDVVIGGSSGYSITVTKTGSGTVKSLPAGIDCGSTCSTSFSSGTSVTLTATPATGTFSGGCSGTGSCTLTMNANKSVTVTFANTSLPNLTPYQPSGWSD
ncbi:MAG: DUF1566 domain-containing protein, partial [Pseudomonadota bacterium]